MSWSYKLQWCINCLLRRWAFPQPKQNCLFSQKSTAEDTCSSLCASLSSASKEPAQVEWQSATIMAAKRVIGFQNLPSFPGRKVWMTGRACWLTSWTEQFHWCQWHIKNGFFSTQSLQDLGPSLHRCYLAQADMHCASPPGFLGMSHVTKSAVVLPVWISIVL